MQGVLVIDARDQFVTCVMLAKVYVKPFFEISEVIK